MDSKNRSFWGHLAIFDHFLGPDFRIYQELNVKFWGSGILGSDRSEICDESITLIDVCASSRLPPCGLLSSRLGLLEFLHVYLSDFFNGFFRAS